LISSRRLAREWALKILYQSDVGKMSIEESQAAALDRLRLDFVQRASQAATGSLLEELLVDRVTAHLFDVLPCYGAEMEVALRSCFAQLFSAGGFWANLDIEFNFSRQSYSALWEAPRRSEAVDLPSQFAALPISIVSSANLPAADRARLLRFLIWAKEALPETAMRAFAREAKLGRPEGAKMKETHEYVVQRWKLFAKSMSERWEAAGQVVEKQTCDWMRVAAFTEKLVTGVHEYGAELDRSLQALEIGWALDRQVSVDRNILRMAAFELAHLRNIPANATINEAVELAKKYSTAESSKFVNGVLGAIVAQLSAGRLLEAADGNAAGALDERADPLLDMEEIPGDEELATV